LIGDFYVKYCVVKAGTYVPLRGFELATGGGREDVVVR
jgi:hypothetical protein